MSRVVVKDKEWRKVRKQIDRLVRKGSLQVGIIAGKGAEDLHEDSGLTMAEIGAVHEFGAPKAGIPQRSFIRGGVKKNADEIRSVIVKVAKGWLRPSATLSIKQGLDIIGVATTNAIRRFITSDDNGLAALKPATVERKGSTRPLVDTGRLLNSITWRSDA